MFQLSIQVSDLCRFFKGLFRLTKELWIGDPVVGMSQWLVAIQHGRTVLDLWNYGSVIPLSIQFSDLCRFFKGLFRLTNELWIGDPVVGMSQWLVATRQGEWSLTFGIRERWSSHRSQSATCGNSLSGCSPWQKNKGSVFGLLVRVVDLCQLAKE